jgi:thiamine biosynthesis lipoprotein ApbE
MAADSLDTALSVMGPKAGLALIEATPDAAAFFVRDTAGKVETFESSRFAEFVVDAPQPQKSAATEIEP